MLEALIYRFQDRLRRQEGPPITTDVLFQKKSPGYVSPSDHVLVVGPGIQLIVGQAVWIPMDKSLIALAPYLAKKGGKLTVLDAPPGIPNFGDYNLDRIKGWFKHISDSKIARLCPIDYIETILLRDAFPFTCQYDCIVDHLTINDWLLMDADFDTTEKITQQIIALYTLLLKPGGKMIIHYENKDGSKPFRKNALESAMAANNLKVTDIHPILDLYEIPKGLQRELEIMRHFAGGLDSRRRLKSFYSSEGILIGQKPDLYF